MFVEILNCLFGGFKVGVLAFLKMLPLYDFLNSLPEYILALITGLPMVVISILMFLIKLLSRER